MCRVSTAQTTFNSTQQQHTSSTPAMLTRKPRFCIIDTLQWFAVSVTVHGQNPNYVTGQSNLCHLRRWKSNIKYKVCWTRVFQTFGPSTIICEPFSFLIGPQTLLHQIFQTSQRGRKIQNEKETTSNNADAELNKTDSINMMDGVASDCTIY